MGRALARGAAHSFEHVACYRACLRSWLAQLPVGLLKSKLKEVQ